ncbi:MAG TPA: TIGR01777 family oxidoreductase [Candidatus Binatia bacterium]
MKLVISGATGFIGSEVVSQLARQNHTLMLLSRKPRAQPRSANNQWMVWDGGLPGSWQTALDGADGVINLAGEPIAAKRWSAARKQALRLSRIDATRALVSAIAKANQKPKFLINASAVGFYGPHGDETLTEESPPGNDFLAQLCAAWEAEANKAKELGLRVALVRTGIVLGKGKGALAKMVAPFKFFAGGRLGSGKQWFPWIHLDDEAGLIKFLIDNEKAEGPFNATAPNPVTMDEFCKALGKVLNRPSWAPVPSSMLSLMLGEMAEMLLTGQRALPAAALKLGYQFKYQNVFDALASLKL